ncbi:hypothetical protein B0H14DRAFT_2331938 [Mycena olivaceomarginata]|nr:hypothetical protein B0H14DRAFT_2331938 [Mycena olivaceomarginata]
MFTVVPWLEVQRPGGCAHYVTRSYPDRTPPLNNRLWAICVPINSKEAAKYHAKNAGGKWLFEDPVPLNSIIKSRTISAAIKIGKNITELGDHLEPVSMSIPVIDQAREPEFNCRVWFREAVRVLDQAEILQCREVDALEAECKSYAMGNQIGPNWQGYRYHASSHSF